MVLLTSEYTLHIPASIERRLSRVSALAQGAIRAALRQTVLGATGSKLGTVGERLFPPLRLYANGYRVFYQLERDTHRLVVLSFGKAPA